MSLVYPTEEDQDNPRNNHQKEEHDCSFTTRYMPNVTAAFYEEEYAKYGVSPGSFKRLVTSSQQNAPISRHIHHSWPLVVFSPGYGASRLFYTAIAQEVARNGYIVALLDHSCDAGFIESPNGKFIKGLDLVTLYSLDKAVTSRALDFSFVLDQLSQPSPLHPFSINTSHVVVSGHSLGGATAAEVMLYDDRIKGGLSLDGNFHGKFNSTANSISRPFLLFRAASRVKEGTEHDWDEAWKKLTGWKLDLELANSTHNTFIDVPLLTEALGLRAGLGKPGEDLLGTLEGVKGLEIMSTYVSLFAKFVFTGKKQSILNRMKQTEFPEVKVVRNRLSKAM